jgi:hypothetical protein
MREEKRREEKRREEKRREELECRKTGEREGRLLMILYELHHKIIHSGLYAEECITIQR